MSSKICYCNKEGVSHPHWITDCESENTLINKVTLEDEEELTYQKRVEDYESAKRAELDYNTR